MTPEDVKRAVERLIPEEGVAIEKAGVFVELWEEDAEGLLEFHADLRKPLAALIEAAADALPEDEMYDDIPQTYLREALVALVRAINGDRP